MESPTDVGLLSPSDISNGRQMLELARTYLIHMSMHFTFNTLLSLTLPALDDQKFGKLQLFCGFSPNYWPSSRDGLNSSNTKKKRSIHEIKIFPYLISWNLFFFLLDFRKSVSIFTWFNKVCIFTCVIKGIIIENLNIIWLD